MRLNTQLIFRLTTLLLLTHQVGHGQDNKTAFSLREAIEYALVNNQEGKNARLEIDIAQRQVGEILADGLPQVDLNADLTHNYLIPKTPITNDFATGEPLDETLYIPFGADYTSRWGVGVTQMVFDGSFFIGLEAAKTFTQLSKKDNIRTNIEITENVSKAYFGVLVNKERFLLIERNFTRVDSLLRDTELLYKNGFAEKIDVNRAKVQFNNLKVELDNYQAIVDLSESLLKFQMGFDLKSPIQLSDAIQDIEYFDFELTKDFSYDRRVEYSQMGISKELNELDIKNIKAKYYPKIDLVANFGKNTGNTDLSGIFQDQWFGAGALGLTASMPIFDGLRKRRQVQQRQLKAEQLDYSLDLLTRNIDVEIQQSLSNYNREIERMRAQQENMELAREVYDVTKLKYKEGVGSNIEVIEADASYKEAQINFYNALYDALISKIDLQKAYGVLQ